MPGFDRSGPQGDGPLTGRARGRCRGADDDVRQARGYGRGRGGRGWGGGRGRGW
ncbi:MAG: DUF5320 domain-containing protein, partial [Deltaproteobacteria bacterium]|nr:DUF5320 domain-containing protein [Deltaproteobacteria bacterium]MBW2537801.1 DUF5320 domain-containing protein [Deltaproteobacteria bacterium]